MKRVDLFGGCVALIAFFLGCSEAGAPQAEAKAKDMGFEQQMLAVLPVLDQGTVLKVCNMNARPGDQGSLQFSIEAAQADPNDPGKLIPMEQRSLEQQLAEILPLVDEHHALNIRTVTDGSNGQAHLVFTIQPNAERMKGKDS
ncbi:MAG: hypothetical protein WBB32_13500 [Flavobacteriales bacterium]